MITKEQFLSGEPFTGGMGVWRLNGRKLEAQHEYDPFIWTPVAEVVKIEDQYFTYKTEFFSWSFKGIAMYTHLSLIEKRT